MQKLYCFLMLTQRFPENSFETLKLFTYFAKKMNNKQQQHLGASELIIVGASQKVVFLFFTIHG